MWWRDRSEICGAADGGRRREAGPSSDGDGLVRRRPGLLALRMALRAAAGLAAVACVLPSDRRWRRGGPGGLVGGTFVQICSDRCSRRWWSSLPSDVVGRRLVVRISGFVIWHQLRVGET